MDGQNVHFRTLRPAMPGGTQVTPCFSRKADAGMGIAKVHYLFNTRSLDGTDAPEGKEMKKHEHLHRNSLSAFRHC